MSASPFDPVLEKQTDQLFKDAVYLARASGNKDVKRYLGRKADKELACNSENDSHALQLQLSILFSMAELTEPLELLFRGRLTQIMALPPEKRITIYFSLPALRWSAEKANLTGYAKLFSKPANAPSRVESPFKGMASRLAKRLAENLDPDFYGTPENPSKGWRPDPVPMYHMFLEEMIRLNCLEAQFPFGNDIGWTRDDYAQAIHTDALIIRQQLGFPLTMPNLPENPHVNLPEGFQGFPDWTPIPPALPHR